MVFFTLTPILAVPYNLLCQKIGNLLWNIYILLVVSLELHFQNDSEFEKMQLFELRLI